MTLKIHGSIRLGFQLRTPGLGKYIVPEWVGSQPFDSDVQAIHASEGALPMILQPWKPEKVELAVKVAS